MNILVTGFFGANSVGEISLWSRGEALMNEGTAVSRSTLSALL